MIAVKFLEANTPGWIAWKAKAASTRQDLMKLYASGQTIEFTELYKKQKEHYAKVFSGKCAFCEQIIAANQPGDVEHFRPKGEVSDADNKIVTYAEGLKTKPHPGYFWLAYECTNLLYACNTCNRVRKDKSNPGKLLGKGTRFPVKGRHARPDDSHQLIVAEDAFSAGCLRAEEALLLNPLDPNDDPQYHLMFDDASGVISWISDRGKACIDIYNLNRESLPELRRQFYLSVLATEEQLNQARKFKAPEAAEFQKQLDDCRDGKSQFSFAGRKAIAVLIQRHRDQLAALGVAV